MYYDFFLEAFVCVTFNLKCLYKFNFVQECKISYSWLALVLEAWRLWVSSIDLAPFYLNISEFSSRFQLNIHVHTTHTWFFSLVRREPVMCSLHERLIPRYRAPSISNRSITFSSCRDKSTHSLLTETDVLIHSPTLRGIRTLCKCDTYGLAIHGNVPYGFITARSSGNHGQVSSKNIYRVIILCVFRSRAIAE